MKRSVIFMMAVAVALAGVPKSDEDMVKDLEECFEKAHHPRTKWTNILDNQNYILESQEGRCFYGCVMQEWGIVDADGAFSQTNSDDVDKFLGSTMDVETNEKTQKTMERSRLANAKCSTSVTPNKDPCVIGPSVLQCWQQENKTLFPVPEQRG